MTIKVREITIAHTPDADDAFMFYALTTGILKSNNFSIKHELTSIQNLNAAALSGKYEMSAISFAAYPQVSEHYLLMDCGACMGYKFGPVLLAKKYINKEQIKEIKIAVPGVLTTAFLLLKIYCPEVQTVVLPFNEIAQAVARGDVDAGLVIDGSQMTYSNLGLRPILDLGLWWYEETKLPLPLGGNIVRKDVAPVIADELTSLFRQSIKFSMDNRNEAIKHAMYYAQGMSTEQAQQFIGRYVNEFTLSYGKKGGLALELLFSKGYAAGVLNQLINIEKALLVPKGKFTC